jgi:nucleotide-binding universal stress UspA family protein
MRPKFSKVIVPFDGTRWSERAIARAGALVAPANGKLTIVRVAEPQRDMPISPRSRPAELAGPLAIWSEFQANRRLQDYVAREIVDAAGRHDADVIVMATRARSTLGRLLFGSVSDQVVHTAARPVLLVPPAAADSHGEPPAHAIVALDGSLHAEAALGAARIVAQQCGTPLTLVRVVGPWAEVVRDNTDARNYLEQLSRDLQADGIVAAIQTRYGNTADELVSSAEEFHADLIVMATRARSGIARLAFGSVYASTLRRAHVPVLVVPAARVARFREPAVLRSSYGRQVTAVA